MRNAPIALAVASALVALVSPGASLANADLEQQMANSSNWAAQAGDF